MRYPLCFGSVSIVQLNWVPLIWIITSATLWAQSPKPTELLPATTIFYAEFLDTPAVMRLPFVDNILQSTLFRQLWNTPDAMKLRGGITLAEVALGERLPEALGKLTGQGWAVAIDRASKGVVLWAHARDRATCEELFKKLVTIAENDAKSKGNQLKHVAYRDVDAYEVNKVIVARLDDYVVVTNQGELAKQIVDRWREPRAKGDTLADDTLAGNQRFHDFANPSSAPSGGQHQRLARAWLDLEQMQTAGLAKKLFEGPHDNFAAELLIGGAIAILRGAPTLVATLEADGQQLHLRVDAPLPELAATERYTYFFGPNISGQAPPAIELGRAQANVCLYRDIAQLWQHAGDLFGQKTNDQLAQAETTLTTLFSGRDFATDILGAIHPELQFIVTEQEFGQAGAPVPLVKLPAFALVTRLRDPQLMQPQMKRIFMSFIGFVNVTSATNQLPQLDLDTAKLESGWEVAATYAVETDRPKDWIVPVQYNFSPTLTMSGEYAVIASTQQLARAIAAKLPTQASRAPSQPTGNASDGHLNSLLRLDGELLNKTLSVNRQQLISQNMVEKGHSADEAAAEIDLLLQAVQLIKSVSLAFTIGRQASLQLALDMSAPAPVIAGWPNKVTEIEYRSQADNSLQPALLYDPGGQAKKPLLVALHSWSGNYRQANGPYAQWCIEHDWVMIHPDFRGINDHPEACGSELVVKDILSAVDHCRKSCRIDENRIYLIGSSGGGYASLLMAGRSPEVWAGVSAWCPIYDLARWHADTKARDLRYDDMLEKVCGGVPGASPLVDEQYRLRSAAHWLPQARGRVNLSINTGITDGHDGSVPIGHTLRAFNAVAAEADAISEETIALMEREPTMPSALRQEIADPSYGDQRPLFRHQSETAQVTIFQGGHEIVYPAGLSWLDKQRKILPAVVGDSNSSR